jgi:hypothetical protein
MDDCVSVRYAAGRAEVQIGDRRLEVERRDAEGRTRTCPIELVSAALGG